MTAGFIFLEGDSIVWWSTNAEEKEVIGHLVEEKDVLHCMIPPENEEVICLYEGEMVIYSYRRDSG